VVTRFVLCPQYQAVPATYEDAALGHKQIPGSHPYGTDVRQGSVDRDAERKTASGTDAARR